MIKGSILQEDITIFNVYAPKNRASKYGEGKIDKTTRRINESTFIVGDVNTLLSQMERFSRQKKKKNQWALLLNSTQLLNWIQKFSWTVELNSTTQLDLSGICRILHPTTAEYTLFSNSHGKFTKTSHSGP